MAAGRATLHPLSDGLPPALTLDTSFLYRAIYSNQAGYRRAWVREAIERRLPWEWDADKPPVSD